MSNTPRTTRRSLLGPWAMPLTLLIGMIAFAGERGQVGVLPRRLPQARPEAGMQPAPLVLLPPPGPWQIVLRVRTLGIASLAAVWLAACALAFWFMKPDDVFLFHAPWLLHPFEQEHLVIARQIAHNHTLFIRDAWFGQPGHGSEDGAFANGAVVPRTALLIYFIYAVPFLISDTAWLWVSPLFALASAAAATALVRRRTRSNAAGGLAGIALAMTAPVMIAGSGLAFDNIVALTFFLWALYALDRTRDAGSARWGLTSGALFAAAALVRPDHLPAGIAAAGAICLAEALAIRRTREMHLRRRALRVASVAVPAIAALALILATNWLLYGSPSQTGYSAAPSAVGPVWSGSAGGILNNLRRFDAGDFWQMSQTFMWDIGRAQAMLLALGIAALCASRKLDPVAATLLGFAGFLLALDLGHVGTHGGVRPILVNSPPRYLLPVYAAGIVLGFEGLHRAGRIASGRRRLLPAAILAGVTILVAGRGLQEAYGTQYGFVEEQRATTRLRHVRDFAVQHPDDVFVGDVFTKGLLGQRTIIPRLIPDSPAALPRYVRDDLADGRRVFIVETRKEIGLTPERRGYFGELEDAGLVIVQVNLAPPVLEVLEPRSARPELALLAPENGAELSGGATVVADAAAAGDVERVDYYVDGVFYISQYQPPYVWSWDTRSVTDGPHRMSAVAVAASGAWAKREADFAVANFSSSSPSVFITSPRQNETVSGPVRIQGAAADPDGIASTMFYVDGQYWATVTSEPWAWEWQSQSVPDGIHSLWIKALDRSGSWSATYVTVRVQNEELIGPPAP
ncbi:MAG: Ig-like domain-containing protein [Chloroflexi bacterium]|nr:Ig-like domain-containing protein [Chloroflexota bacterium]